MKQDFLRVVWDDKDRKYYVWRPDIPENNWQEITFNAARQLAQDAYKYQMDAINERNGTNLP